MRIGWSKMNLSPERPVILRGQFHSRISEAVNDPVTATALALEGTSPEGGLDRFVMVSCDRVSVPGEIHARVAAAVAERVPGFTPDMIMVNATHTHTAQEVEEGIYPPPPPGVMTPTECARDLVTRLTGAVVAAWEAMAPGGVSWAYSHAVVGHNRRVQYAGGMSQMYGDSTRADFECMEGYEDHGVDLLFTYDVAGKLTGMVINLACPSQVTEGASFVSADYWHEVRQEIAQRHGSVFILPQCSAAGDQSPHLLVHKAEEARMLAWRGLSERQEIGRRIADAVDDVLNLSAQHVEMDPPMAHAFAALPLPARMVTAAEYQEALRQLDHWEAQTPDDNDLAAVSVRHVMLHRYGRIRNRYLKQGEATAYLAPVYVVRLGDIAFATNPFELFLDYGLRMKSRSRALQTFVVQLTGSGADTFVGYLPTARAMAARSYGAEVADMMVGPEGGQVLVDRTLEMIEKFWS